MKSVNETNELSIEQIAYILIQLLQICHEFTEQKGVYFYQDMVPENVYLSYYQNIKSDESDFKSTF